MGRALSIAPLALAAALAACSAEVDYGGTEYQCLDGVTCPDGTMCVDERCILVDLQPRPMIAIPEISFVMGCEVDEATGCEEPDGPPHPVTVSAFEIDATEVTQLDYWFCVAEAACSEPSGFRPAEEPEAPVTYVTWNAARTFCEWAGKRLPTEAEWEVAARGAGGATYPWGEEAPDCQRAHFASCAPARTVPVGERAGDVSPFGAIGMAGNVAEWVSDWFDPTYYETSPERDPTGPEAGTERAVRGGSYNDSAEELTTWKREGDDPVDQDEDTGVRCAR